MGRHLAVEDLWKAYGDNIVLKNIWLEIERSEFFVLVGPSGSGKTTLLRIIAGFEEPLRGLVIINDEKVNDKPPHKRNLGVLFQKPALFPHMNVYENIAFGLRIRRWSEESIRRRVRELLELVGLDPEIYSGRMPHQLSGGEQQRIALARALAPDPEILLLDEPLSHLDYLLRKRALSEFKRLQRELKITFFYITHDQWEAMILADRIAVIYRGEIQQIGRPKEIYEKPENIFVASFIGDNNIFNGSILNGEIHIQSLGITVKSVNGETHKNTDKTHKVAIAIRPENIKIIECDRDVSNKRGVVQGYVRDEIYLGSYSLLKVSVGEGEIIVRNNSSDIRVGDKVCIEIDSSKLVVYPQT
ncbi:MAG: ABC transporter ATP-binding protein [Sulfolobales archaeon]